MSYLVLTNKSLLHQTTAANVVVGVCFVDMVIAVTVVGEHESMSIQLSCMFTAVCKSAILRKA